MSRVCAEMRATHRLAFRLVSFEVARFRSAPAALVAASEPAHTCSSATSGAIAPASRGKDHRGGANGRTLAELAALAFPTEVWGRFRSKNKMVITGQVTRKGQKCPETPLHP